MFGVLVNSEVLINLKFKKMNRLTKIKIIKGTITQIEKALINDRLRVSRINQKFLIPTIYNFAVIYHVKFAIFLKISLLFNSFYCLFYLQTKL